MIIEYTETLPKHLNRGFISAVDRKMIYKNERNYLYKLKVSSVRFTRCNIANYYHQSDIFSRVMARLVERGDFDRDVMLSGGYVSMHDRLVAGDMTAWDEVTATCEHAAKYKRLVPKCLTFIRSTDDCFKMLPMLKGYWCKVLKLPAAYLSAYIEGMDDQTDGAIYSVNRLLTTPTFKALDEAARAQWLTHLTEYAAAVNQVERLEAVRDYAEILITENGASYQFLKNSCNELLL